MDEKYSVMVSVCVPTYNHEKYIVRALDSILMQQTQYSYEVLVGEDKSTDNTRSVLQEYERKNPGKICVFYREENMNRMPVGNSLDLKYRSKGKYLIILEGDDYWTDPCKIEKQVSFLESHPQYIAVSHNCIVVDSGSEPNGEQYPECKENEYTFEHFFKGIMPGQLTTVMCRNFMLDEDFDKEILLKELSPGDRLMYFALLCHGRIFCAQEIMSAYRHVTNTGSSYSANVKFKYEKEKEWYGALAEYASVHCSKEIWINTQYLLLGVIVMGLKHRQIRIAASMKEFKAIPNKIGVISVGIKRIVKKTARKI